MHRKRRSSSSTMGNRLLAELANCRGRGESSRCSRGSDSRGGRRSNFRSHHASNDKLWHSHKYCAARVGLRNDRAQKPPRNDSRVDPGAPERTLKQRC